MSSGSQNNRLRIFLIVILMISTFSAQAAMGSISLDGLLALMIGLIAIVPLVLLKFSISRAKSGINDKKVMLLALPGVIFLILLVIMFISAIYQGSYLGYRNYLFGIDGIFMFAILIYSSWRIWILIGHLRINSESKIEAENNY